MPVLDTNFLVALQAGDEPARQLLEEIQGQPLLVPGIVAVEFLTPYGKKAGAAYEELHRAFTLVHTSEDWVHEATRQRQRLLRSRRSIRLADFWIATWAFLHDTYVVTRNVKDFQALGAETRTW